MFFLRADRDVETDDLAASQLEKPLRILDGALGSQPYLLGPSISVADLNVSHGMFWLALAGVELEAHPRVKGWLERLADRPALQRTWGWLAGSTSRERDGAADSRDAQAATDVVCVRRVARAE